MIAVVNIVVSVVVAAAVTMTVLVCAITIPIAFPIELLTTFLGVSNTSFYCLHFALAITFFHDYFGYY